MANRVDPDEVAHYEPPLLDLHCLQIQLFSYFGTLRLKALEIHYELLFIQFMCLFRHVQ